MQTNLWKLYTTIPTSLNSQPTAQKSKSCACAKTWLCSFKFPTILVPRGRAPFGQHQESRPLAKSNTGSPRFTDFPSLCACNSDKSDWFWFQSIVFTKPFKNGMSLDWARGRDSSWCWPKGARPLGTRMISNVHKRIIFYWRTLSPRVLSKPFKKIPPNVFYRV